MWLTTGATGQLLGHKKLLFPVVVRFHCVFRTRGEEVPPGGTPTPSQPRGPRRRLHPEGPQSTAGHPAPSTLKVSRFHHDGVRQLRVACAFPDAFLVTCGSFRMTDIPKGQSRLRVPSLSPDGGRHIAWLQGLPRGVGAAPSPFLLLRTFTPFLRLEISCC